MTHKIRLILPIALAIGLLTFLLLHRRGPETIAGTLQGNGIIAYIRTSKLVSSPAIDQIEDTHDQGLFPPVSPMVADMPGWRCVFRAVCHA